MTATVAHGEDHSQDDHHADHGPGFYIKIWAILLVLLIISILGPMLGNVWITLLTAFGIALVKAGMVATYFMHLNIEQKYIWYLLFAMLVAMGALFMGTTTDIMHYDGQHWVNQASHNLAEFYRQAPKEGSEHHH